MSGAGILEIVVPEKAQSTLEVPTPKVSSTTTEPVITAQEESEESEKRLLLIGALILGATMLSAIGCSLLIWAYLR